MITVKTVCFTYSNPVYVSVIHGHDQGSLLSRTMDRAMPPSVRVLYAELPSNRFSMGALEAVLDLWANKTIVACLLLIPEPVGLIPALTATNYKVPILWLPSVQRVDKVSLSFRLLSYYHPHIALSKYFVNLTKATMTSPAYFVSHRLTCILYLYGYIYDYLRYMAPTRKLHG